MEKLVRGKTGKKIILLLVIILLFNFIMPKKSEAVTGGGILLKPLCLCLNYWLTSVDITISLFLQGRQFTEEIIDDIIKVLQNLADNGKTSPNDLSDKSTTENEVNYNNKKVKVGEFFIGPDTIFSGKVQLLDANIFDDLGLKDTNGDGKVDEGRFEWDDVGFVDLAHQLRKTVAGIYVALRNLAAIILLIALIYTGIKVLISSNMPARKSEWVMMVQDWVIGLMLLIFSHIIMVSVFYISDTLVDAISQWIGEGSFVQEVIIKGLMSWDSAVQIIYLIMFGYLLYLTIVFAVSYFKRLFWICILIIIAPVVSVMYALGKGTKDIYMNWLKEFLGAVFVQPFHIVMYFVLVSIPLGIVKTDGVVESLPFTAGFTAIPRLIYGLLAMGMIKPFEKYLTSLFKMGNGIASMASREYGEKVIKAQAEKVGKAAILVGTAVATGGASLAATGTAQTMIQGTKALKGGLEAIKGGSNSLLETGKNAAKKLLGPAGDSSLEGKGSSPKLLNGKVDDQDTDNTNTDSSPKLLNGKVDNRETDNENTDSSIKSLKGDIDDQDTDNENTDSSIKSLKGDIDDQDTDNTNIDSNKKILNGDVKGPEYDEDGLVIIEDEGEPIELSLEDIEVSDPEEPTDTENVENSNASTILVNGLSNLLVGNANNAMFAGNINTNSNENDTENNNENNTKDNEEKEDKKEEARDPFKEAIAEEKSKGKLEDWFEKGKNIMGSTDMRNSFADYKDASIKAAELNYVLPGGTAGSGGDLSVQKDNVKSFRDKTEKKKEKEHNKFVNDDKNINYVMDKYGLKDKYRAQYPDKSEAYIEQKAKEDAKSKLKEMTPYVDKGITDIGTVSQLYDKQRETGMSPNEVVKNTFVGAINNEMYNTYNNDEEVVAYINEQLGTNGKTVEDAIPNSKQLYDAGFKTAKSQVAIEMSAKEIQEKFKIDIETARSAALEKAKMVRNGTTVSVPQKPTDREETNEERINREFREYLNKGNRDTKTRKVADKMANKIEYTAQQAKDKAFKKIVHLQNDIKNGEE